MSNNKAKPVKMSLGEFHNYVKEQEQEKIKKSRTISGSRRGGGGKLSDRLKSRRTQGRDNRTQRRSRPVELQTAAKVAGSKPSVDNLSFNENTFPALGESVVETVVKGAWTEGIQTIINAKDLPDPSTIPKNLQRHHPNDDYVSDESEFYSDDYYDDSPHSENEPNPVDDKEWDDVM